MAASTEEAVHHGAVVDEALRKRTIGWQLVFGTGMHFLGSMIGMQAEQEIWIKHFAGNFAANASMNGRLQALSGIISFAINPIIAAASDAFGRRPCMLVAQATALWRCVAMAANPSVTNLVIGDLSRSLTMSAWFIAAQASLGDLFKTEPNVYGKYQSFFQMMPPAMSMVCPMLGHALAARSLRLPYAVGTVLYLINMLTVWFVLPETCGAKERVPFSVRGSNPLTFTKLFANGPRLRLLALAEAVSALTDGRATFQVGMLDRRSRLGWNMKQVCVRVCACVYAFVRVRVCACVRLCVPLCVRARAQRARVCVCARAWVCARVLVALSLN